MRPASPALPAAVRKTRLLRSFVAGRPVHCTWQLTPRCESFCHFCEHRSESSHEDLDAAACGRISDELGEQGALLVSFTGAEPFLREDLPAIVAAVARRHFPLLVTNGWLVSAPAARAVWNAGLEVATVAFEHADPGAHDALTGVPGSHARAAAALETLSGTRRRRGQRVNIRARVRGGDVDALIGLLELAARQDATVSLEAPVPLPVLDGEAQGLMLRLRELKRRHPQLRTGGAVLERLDHALTGGVGGCLAGRAFFNVDHRGRVSRCLEFRPPVDDAGSPAEEGWREVNARLRSACSENSCRACFYASRGEVETLYTVRGFLGGLKALVGA